MKNKLKNMADLFFLFFKIGAFTFGGGYAMLPIIQREIVEKRKIATDEEILNYYAVGQCTPGVIAVNTATFIGNRLCGVCGAIASTIGIVMPSLIIITVIAAFLSNFADYAIVQNAFSGIRVAVCAMIVLTLVKMWKQAIHDKIGICICVIAFAISAFSGISPVYVVIAAACVGLLVKRGEKE